MPPGSSAAAFSSVRSPKAAQCRIHASRAIDLDLLVYDNVTFESPELTVPHAGIGERNFVLLPLRDLAPELVIPGLGPLSHLPVPDEPAIERISDAPWH